MNNVLITLAALLCFLVFVAVDESRRDDEREVITSKSGQLVVCSDSGCWVRLGDSTLIPAGECDAVAAVRGCRVSNATLRDFFGY